MESNSLHFEKDPMADMSDTGAVLQQLAPLLAQVLQGETIQLGCFQIWEEFHYTRTKDPTTGQPRFRRVLAFVYFDEEEDDHPALEDFDGTPECFLGCLDAHNVLDYYTDTDERL